MHPTKPSNTQVYSPLGSFVVEQQDETTRSDAIKRQYQGETYRSQTAIAVTWLLLFVMLVGGSIYNRLGRPDVAATSAAEAATKATADKPSKPVSD